MQPKRDPADRRFWPVRLGGTAGFSEYHRKGQPSPYRYGSLSHRGSLAHRQQPARAATSLNTVTEIAKQIVDADAVRARARLLTIAVMDDIDARRSSMDDAKLVDALNAAGKLTGVQSSSVQVQHSHRLMSGEERARRAAELIQRAQSRLLMEGADSTNEHTSPETEDANVLPDNDIE